MPNVNQAGSETAEVALVRHIGPNVHRRVTRAWFRSRGFVAFVVMAAVAIAGYALLFWLLDTILKA